MSKITSKLLIFLLLIISAHPSFGQEEKSRKKVAVVLSGGGAKGVAHVNALRVIREVGIPIDYLVGTSMGSIIAGLSAIGYTPDQLEAIVNEEDWPFLLSDKIKRSEQTMAQRKTAETFVLSLPINKSSRKKATGGLIQGINLNNLFQELTMGYHDSIRFDNLPIPFACVSEDVVNGTKYVFHEGVLSTAMRSSMAIPAVFTPVRIDSAILVDGGMIDNFPVDIALDMGADYVIGVDVQNNLKTVDELNSTPEILMQIIGLTGLGLYEENVKKTDVYIKVDVEGYSTYSFVKADMDSLMVRGLIAAEAKRPELIELKKKLGLEPDYRPNYPVYQSAYIEDKKIYIDNISFTGIQDDDKKWLLRKCKLKEDSPFITKQQLQNALSILRGGQAYSSVNYKLTPTQNGKYNLTFLLQEKYEKNINIGVRFDSEEIASLLLNASLHLKTKIPSKIGITGRLGQRYLARLDYSIEPLQMRNFNFAYQFEYNDINIFDRGKKAYNTTYKYHLGEFSFSDIWFRNLLFELGLRFEHYKYSNILYNSPQFDLKISPEHFFTYFIKLHYNSFNKAYFPTRGANFRAGYSLVTDNFVKYDDNSPFSEIDASWEGAYSTSNNFTILPSVYGRVLAGNKIAYPFSNFIGGNYFGRFVTQQMPFAGITHMSLAQNSAFIVGLKLRQQFGKSNYVTLNGNVLFQGDEIDDIFNNTVRFGVSAGYAYSSIFGPLEAIIGYSNQSKKASFYVNLGYYF